MCRWITLISTDPVSLSDVVLAPSNSLVHQSRDATFHPGYEALNNAPMNGDGFGVGWYHTNVAICPNLDNVSTDGSAQRNGSNPPTTLLMNGRVNGSAIAPEVKAAVFKDIHPAWNNMNLREICMATASNCIVAHIRAASKGTGISHQNCHPFKAGRLLFCHNGRIDNYSQIKRRFLDQVSDEAFVRIMGTTDSECVFALVMTHLANDGYADVSPYEQKTPFGYKRLTEALKKTLRQIENILTAHGNPDGYSTCNFSLTDGETMVVTRFCDKSPDIPPPSLYFAFGNARKLMHELTSEQITPIFASPHKHQPSSCSSDSSDTGSVDSDGFESKTITLDQKESRPGKVMEDVNPTTAAFIVSSNPLTNSHTWHPMPNNSIMWCTRGCHPELRVLRRAKSTVSALMGAKGSLAAIMG